jgi:hypothetical protein
MAATSAEAKERTEARMFAPDFREFAAGANDGRIAIMASTRG